jgi:hypothetical protein
MSKLPSTYIKNYVSGLLKTYGHSCPVMSRFINGGSCTSLINDKTDSKKKCPFLEDKNTAKVVKEVSKEIQEDIIEPKYDAGYYFISYIFISYSYKI